MHTDSSASITYLASVSASEWIATVLMPISRQARWMRSAISPRLAISIFSNMDGLLDQEERLSVLHGLAVLDQDRLHGPRLVAFDLVQELHRLDDAQGLPLGDRLADLDEGWSAGGGRAIEGSHHRRLERVPLGLGLRRRAWSQTSRGRADRQRLGRGAGHDHRGPGGLAADAHLLLAFGDLDLADARLLDEVDQLLELPQIHVRARPGANASRPRGPARSPSVPGPRSRPGRGRKNRSGGEKLRARGRLTKGPRLRELEHRRTRRARGRWYSWMLEE